MGILNVTPDSFSDGGRHAELQAALAQAEAMRRAGALVIDVGGESTRPGAVPVDAAEEIDRVQPVVAALAERGFIISVDTMKPEVAQVALDAGAHLVNDVSGLRDPEMIRVCAQAGAPVCLMHMQGEPHTMQRRPVYSDVVDEVAAYLKLGVDRVRARGVPDVMVDPGIGFGKTLEHNLSLMQAVPRLAGMGAPVLIGASRKGLIGTLTGEADPTQRDPGTLALHLHAARMGAAMVRVHAPFEHVQALKVQAALDTVGSGPDASGAPVSSGVSESRVVLQGLEFFGRHGVFAAEAELGARFVVDAELHYPFADTGDDLSGAVNYAEAYAAIADVVTQERFDLIEALAARIGRRLLAEHPALRRVTVRVHKPGAPVAGIFRDIYAELTLHRGAVTV